MSKKFELAKGWTKKKVMDQVKKFNNNTRSMGDKDSCAYKNNEGNRCAIGCFIPNRSRAFGSSWGVEDLLGMFPQLKKSMPFEDVKALIACQEAHDDAKDGVKGKTVYDLVAKFLKNKVK